jgi:hypothetical protein
MAAAYGPQHPPGLADHDLIEHHVERVTVSSQALEVHLLPVGATAAQREEPDTTHEPGAGERPGPTLVLPFAAPSFAAAKGILHAPSAKPAMTLENRDTLLAAIVKARRWIDDVKLGHLASFAAIADREGQGERYIRQLANLAFVSPRIIAAIIDGTAPADLTVTSLATALPYSWAVQEQRIEHRP